MRTITFAMSWAEIEQMMVEGGIDRDLINMQRGAFYLGAMKFMGLMADCHGDMERAQGYVGEVTDWALGEAERLAADVGSGTGITDGPDGSGETLGLRPRRRARRTVPKPGRA